jgi:REP element-mobilizing transposase RayT
VLAPRSIAPEDNAMVLAYHCIFGMYGFWLPNDPRGSGSEASWELFRYGPATKTRGRRSVAYRPHDRAAREQAKRALKHPPVILTGKQSLVAAQGFAWAAQEGGYQIHACAVMPDHVHLVIGRHSRKIRKIVGHMKARATRLLHLRGSWHTDDRPVWGEHGWNVFLSTADEVEHAIEYANENPEKEQLPTQTWSFVTPFNPTVDLATRRGASAVQAPRQNVRTR